MKDAIDCTGAAAQAGIAILASDVDLNLNGQTLSASGSGTPMIGVAVGTGSQDCSSSSGTIRNVRIRGGSINGFPKAVISCGAVESIFDHLAIANGESGIVLEGGSNNNFVLANTISTSAIGIEIGADNDGSDVDAGNMVNRNEVTFQPPGGTGSDTTPETAGILLYSGATATELTANNVGGGWASGIDLRRCAAPVGQPRCAAGPSGNFVQQSVSTGNSSGIRVSGSKGNRLQDNASTGGGRPGQGQGDVVDDNNGLRHRPCANVWDDNFYRTKFQTARCIPRSRSNSVSPR